MLLAAFLLVWSVWLAFTFVFPDKWARLVDREHEFFLKRGIVSASVSRGFKRLEKGIMLRVVLTGTIIIGLMDLTIVLLRCVLGFRF
jgi:hypothetical protein